MARVLLRGFAAALICLSTAARAEQDGLSEPDIRQIVADYTPGAPNFADLLADRFPEDLVTLMDAVASLDQASPSFGRQAMAELAKTLAAEQLRYGASLYSAPDADLVAVLETQRDLMAALAAAQPDRCRPGAAGAMPTPETRVLFLKRLQQILIAISDGRDDPVPERIPRSSDFVELARAASEQGVDTKDWAMLKPDQLAAIDPAAMCRAFLSVYKVALGANGDAAERIRAFMAHDLLTPDLQFAFQPSQ